ncbi:hypothetical protein N9H09_00260 [bacterium]|nr:hypothetical protein [bacterium]
MLNKLTNYRKNERLIRRFFSNVNHSEPSKGRIMQFVGISSMYLTPVEILINHLLRQRGYNVDYVVYDETVSIFETITKKTRNPEAAPKRTWKIGKRLLKAAKVPYTKISLCQEAEKLVDSIEDLDALLTYRYDNIELGEAVHGTLCRYYQSTKFDEDAERIARKMLITTLGNYLYMRKMCKKNNYKYIMFSHGINISWQPVADFCRREGKQFIVYDRGKTKDHANFNVNQSSPDWSFDSAWERFRERQLSKMEKDKVAEYLKEREHQKNDVYAYNFSGKRGGADEEKSRLGIPLERKCVTIFTNLIWDAANVSRDIAFPSAFECVVETIKYFRERKDVQVVLRCHPAEMVLGTDERYSDKVREYFRGDLPCNVTLIEPEDDVNSFSVIDISDVGVVNTSTVGLEIAMLGKPSIIISETHYRKKGFTVDVEDERSYFSEIESALKRPCIPIGKQELAKKYFYMMMFLYQKKMPVSHDGLAFKGYSCNNFKDLKSEDQLVKIINTLSGVLPSNFISWDEDD